MCKLAPCCFSRLSSPYKRIYDTGMTQHTQDPSTDAQEDRQDDQEPPSNDEAQQPPPKKVRRQGQPSDKQAAQSFYSSLFKYTILICLVDAIVELSKDSEIKKLCRNLKKSQEAAEKAQRAAREREGKFSTLLK